MAAPGLRTLYLLVVVVLMALQAQCYSPQALRAFMPSGHMALSRRNQALVIRAEGTTTGQSVPAGKDLKLCRVCKQYFDPGNNGPRACRYHPKAYTGDTKRKGDWSANKDRFELERMWWCCGEPDPDSPGCTYDSHKTYDD